MNWIRAWLAGSALTVVGLAAPLQGVDSVKIVSISPDKDATLRVGEKVIFRVEIEYNLASTDLGRVTLVIQPGESGQPPLVNEREVVPKGTGRLIMSKELEVPDTRALRVFTPLNVQGASSTRIVDTRSYSVEGSGLPGASVPQQEKDRVEIISISPETHAALRVGERVTFRVEVECNLGSADSGWVSLVIQQGESGRAGLSNEMDAVLKGTTRVVLTKDIMVPDTDSLQVFVPLHVQGGGSTHVVATRFYRVAKI